MNNKKMMYPHIKHNDEAVAGIIVAVLVIALIISVVAIIQTVFVPQWMEQKEAEHMQTVFNQFTMMKYSIDTQALTQNKQLSLTTSITLGNKELPILSSVRSYGYLAVNESKTELEVKKRGDGNAFQVEQKFGIVQYNSKNAYFVDKKYVYEAGALIVSQADGNIIAITPEFQVQYDEDKKEINMTFSLINTRGIGDRQSIGGYGTYPIRARFKNFEQKKIDDVEIFRFPTAYKDAWMTFIIREFTRQGIILEGNDALCNITKTDNGIDIEFYEGECTGILNFNVYTVDVQISPGWIE